MPVCIPIAPSPFLAVDQTTALVPPSAFTNLQSESVPSVKCSKNIPIQKGNVTHLKWGYWLGIYIFKLCLIRNVGWFGLGHFRKTQLVFDRVKAMTNNSESLSKRFRKGELMLSASTLMVYLITVIQDMLSLIAASFQDSNNNSLAQFK